MFINPQQVMTEPYFDDDRRDFTDGIGNKMIPVRNVAQGTKSRYHYIGRIGIARPSMIVRIQLYESSFSSLLLRWITFLA